VQFMLLIYEDESIYGPDKDGSAMQQIVAKHMAFNRELGAVRIWLRIGGAGLKSTTSATTVRTAKGKQSIHDGPFAESKEQLGGFYLIDVPDLDAAIAVAKKVPVLQEGSIEIRPVLGP